MAMVSGIELHFDDNEIANELTKYGHRSLETFFRLHPSPWKPSPEEREERFRYMEYYWSRRLDRMGFPSGKSVQFRRPTPRQQTASAKGNADILGSFFGYWEKSGLWSLADRPFSLTPTEDLSGIGVRARWLTRDEIIEEISELLPGKATLEDGIISCGECLLGSGDYLYLTKPDTESDPWTLVRVAHDSLTKNGNCYQYAYELVARNITELAHG